MQRLTLILSDLYLPEEAAGQAKLTHAIALPNLDWLLRFADPPRRIRDWRHWLAEEVGESRYARLPVAQACEIQFLAQGPGSGWLATPVHLEARLDHVRLVDRGVLRIAAAQRPAWCAEFAQAFGPQYSLHDIGERAFLLTGIAPTAAQSQDPVRLLDADIATALPRGPEAAELRRLGTEIEMWLYRAALNRRREQAHEPRISALWLWGGGQEPHGGAAATAPRIAAMEELRFHGGDPFLLALAESFALSHRREVRCIPTPPSFAALEPGAGRAVVELTPMSGSSQESLHSLEANWFVAVRAALNNGSLASCDLVANDRWFRIHSRAGWKFWRRSGSWLQRLGSESPEAKA
jgi:hypothetical protein